MNRRRSTLSSAVYLKGHRAKAVALCFSGKMVPLHFHHGDEFHLVLSGEWAAQVEGKPDHIMKSGNAQYVERERWHGGKAIGSVPLKVLGVMIVDKDKPIIEMKR
jgi:quercetin dioxygenase-like cupin family protein